MLIRFSPNNRIIGLRERLNFTKEKTMIDHNDRVLVRAGARTLTPQEIKVVSGGGRGTDTVCTFRGSTVFDGDPGEC